MYLFLSQISAREKSHKYVYLSSNEALKHLITNHQGLMISTSVEVKECVPLVPKTSFVGSRNCFETLDVFWNDKCHAFQVFDVVIGRCDQEIESVHAEFR